MPPTQVELDFAQEVAETKVFFPGANSGQKFARAVLSYSYGLKREEAINANSCDGERDRGLDAYFSDDESFYLIQFKHHEDPFGRAIAFSASGAGHQLVHCWPIVSDLNVASGELAARRIRQELYGAAEAFRDEVTNEGKAVRMVVVEWADGDPTAAKISGETWMRSLPAGHPIESFEVENFSIVRKRWEKLKLPARRYRGDVPLRYRGNSGYTIVSAPYRGIVVTVSGQEIVQLSRTAGENLLDPNVRFGLPSSRYNLRIRDTARSSPELFWYYNNGITIICDTFTGEGTGILTITNPGVVNGGQTVKKLREAGAISDSLNLIVRVIESGEGTLTENIALYTNSQNPIRARDLKSNLDEQMTYETEFKSLTPSWFYERKRGSWEILEEADRAGFVIPNGGDRTRKYRRLSNEVVGKAVLAFSLEDPVSARAKKDSIWIQGQNGFYDSIFTKGRDVYELATASLTQMNLENMRSDFHPREGRSIDEISYNILHLTALMGKIIRRKYPSPDRNAYRRLYDNLIDPATGDLSRENFVSSIFERVLWPCVTAYHDARRADPNWDADNWYKNKASWRPDPGAERKMSYLTVFYEQFAGYHGPASPDNLAAVIP